MHKLVFCRALHADAMKLLEARSDLDIKILTTAFRGPPMQKELEAEIQTADAVMIGLEKITPAMFASAPQLRAISRFGVGFDNIDIPTATQNRVIVGVVNGANDLSVAEHTMMLMLAVARRTLEMDASVRRGTWMLLEGRRMRELAGRRILIFGYGRIGTRVARLCQAFGMHTIVHDPAFPTPRLAADGHEPAPDPMEFLPTADVVSLHCPLNEGTRGMVNADFLSKMKPESWLINSARGGLVDEAALVEALRERRIEAAGIDVLVQEPPVPDHPLFALDNVVLAPHNAAAPLECYRKMSLRAVRNILDSIDGRIDPGYVVNPEVLGRNT
ncbi:MAG: hydroxyacid dehydrogenase [Acetobacteraceae bacterium]|nr:hydroxyacid dehydrogenase [Acetobacteraceae bacterium]